MSCDSTVQAIRRLRPRQGLGILTATCCLLSIAGRAAGVGDWVRSSAPIGRAALHFICHATASALRVTTTGEPKCRRKSGVPPKGSFNTWSSFMNFSIAETIRRLWAPKHEVSCSWFLWRRLLTELRKRGRGKIRESGAFLLGLRRNGRARIVDFVPYDDLDPNCLDSGIIRFDGRYFGDALGAVQTTWPYHCRRRAYPPGQLRSEPFRPGSSHDYPGWPPRHHITVLRPISGPARRDRYLPLPRCQTLGHHSRWPAL